MIVEAVVPRGSEIVKHNLAFVDGVGLVQHFTDFIDRSTFQYNGFKGLELIGCKVGQQQRGYLEDMHGVDFQGLEFRIQVSCAFNIC